MRLPALIRQTDVFNRLIAGQSYAQICAELGISQDTLARDVQAIGEEVRQVAKERVGELLTVALANYQFVIDEARKNYEADSERVTQWYSGALDYETSNLVTETLAIEAGEESEGRRGKGKNAAAEAMYRDLALQQESQPLKVRRTSSITRPALVNDRAGWLRLIIEATREFCELLGIKKSIVEVSGPGGGPVEVSDARQRLFERLARRAADADEGGASSGAGGTG